MKKPLEVFINKISVNYYNNGEHHYSYHGDGVGDFEIIGDGVINVNLIHDYEDYLTGQLTLVNHILEEYKQ